MNAAPPRFPSASLIAATVLLVSACAHPATEVAVDTMPMKKALDIARADAAPMTPMKHEPPPMEKRALPPGLQGSILSMPDVRMAYLFEWIDGDGNRHYGEWVAIPVSNPRWIMSDGTQPPIDTNSADLPAAVENP